MGVFDFLRKKRAPDLATFAPPAPKPQLEPLEPFVVASMMRASPITPAWRIGCPACHKGDTLEARGLRPSTGGPVETCLRCGAQFEVKHERVPTLEAALNSTPGNLSFVRHSNPPPPADVVTGPAQALGTRTDRGWLMRISRADGIRVNQDAKFFVLRIDNDPAARAATRAYAEAVKDVNPQLSSDIKTLLEMYPKPRAEAAEDDFVSNVLKASEEDRERRAADRDREGGAP